VPAGYAEPLVVCRLKVGSGLLGYETAAERIALDGQRAGGIGLVLKAGWTWTCDWFSVPGEDQAGLDKHGRAIVSRAADTASRRLRLAA
jgi:hypothetical protein